MVLIAYVNYNIMTMAQTIVHLVAQDAMVVNRNLIFITCYDKF